MMKRSGARSPEEFGSSSGKLIGEIESVVKVEPGSRSVSYVEAEAAEAPSPPPMFTFATGSDVEQVDSRSRLIVFRGAYPPAPKAVLH